MINIWKHSGRTCSKDWSYTRVIQYEFVGAANEEVRDVQSRFKHRSIFKKISMSLNDKKMCYFILKFCFRSACRELCLGATTYLCRWLFRTIFHLRGWQHGTTCLWHLLSFHPHLMLLSAAVVIFQIPTTRGHESPFQIHQSHQWLSSFRAMKANYNVSKF